MNILISGASGLIGSRLIEILSLDSKNKISILTRSKKDFNQLIHPKIKIFEWNPKNHEIDHDAMTDIDCVINLAGASISDTSWDAKGKKLILDSRISSTKLLVDTINNLDNPPKKIINASAIGFYGNRGDKEIDESSAKGAGFLSDVCFAWENALTGVKIKSHILRIGLVLSSQGGILKEILPIFKFGIGGNISSGDQYMSWIHIDDLVNQIIYLAENDCDKTIYNGTAPEPVSNDEFTSTLAKTLKRPAFMHVPKLALKVILRAKSELVLTGQKVTPQGFINEDFKYQYRTLKDALKDILC